jgi:DNA-binding transcriptional LysR family regulator
VPQEPADLEHHACLRRSAGKADSIWRLRRRERLELVPVSGAVSANDSGMLRRLCLHGMGIAQLTEYLSRCDDGVQRLVRVLPGWDLGPMPLFALFPSRLVPAKVRVFIDFLQDRLPALRAAREARLRGDEPAAVAETAG